MGRSNKKSPGRIHQEKKPGQVASATFPEKVCGFLSRYDIIILFLALFLAYNTVSGIGFISGDVAPASYLPTSLILSHSVYFDESASSILNPDLTYAFPQVNGHYVSRFPIVTPVLITPIYGLSYFLYTLLNIPLGASDFLILAKPLAKTSAAVITALAGVLVYVTGKELFSKKIAILTTFIFAFATSTWSIGSQSLWQHGMVELLLIAMICLIVKNEKRNSWGYILLLGIVSGLFVFNRPPDAVLLIPVLAYMVWYQRSDLHYYLLGGLFGGLPFLWYNVSVFGNVFGGYAENLSLFTLSMNFVQHYVGLLIAPNVGLLLFCPVLIVSVMGFLKVRDSADSAIRNILLLFGPVILLQILVYSFFTLWASTAAYCFGPRFLSGFIPVLCIYTGFFLNDLFGARNQPQPELAKKIVTGVVVVLIVLSVAIQGIGTFLYGWTSEENQTMDDERAWDPSDSVIINSLSEGSKQVPGISVYILPPLPAILKFSFRQEPMGG